MPTNKHGSQKKQSPTNHNVSIEYSGGNGYEEEDISFEDSFRGFEKIPTVALERLDISEYINTLNTKINHIQAENKAPSYIHLAKLSQKCCVRIVRSDLNELKKLLAHNTRTNKEKFNGCQQDSYLKCNICAKIYTNEKKLQNHQENKHLLVYKPQKKAQKRVSFSDHVIVHEVTEYHRCRKCPKIFETYTALKAHTKLKHKKRKCYICNYCSKKFVDRSIFKVHIKLHCYVCGEFLPSKRKLMEHKRTICHILKKYTCKICGDVYFSYMDLKDHTFHHCETAVYVCNICKDQCKSKCVVAHHLHSSHSKTHTRSLYSIQKLGSESLFVCNFCEESSVERDAIEDHVSCLTGKTDTTLLDSVSYICDQCQDKFESETLMLRHKWTHFLNPSNKSQESPTVCNKTLNTYNVNEPLPDYFKPVVVLNRIKIADKPCIMKPLKGNKLVVNKKTIISKHQCDICYKYYSSRYCLTRHKESVHGQVNYQCNRCEETFAWLGLLQSHNCIRMNIPEMPFDDARPEIQVEELPQCVDHFDVSNDCIDEVDFEFPPPIVEFTEFTNLNIVINNNSREKVSPPRYHVVVQEVPIEF